MACRMGRGGYEVPTGTAGKLSQQGRKYGPGGWVGQKSRDPMDHPDRGGDPRRITLDHTVIQSDPNGTIMMDHKYKGNSHYYSKHED